MTAKQTHPKTSVEKLDYMHEKSKLPKDVPYYFVRSMLRFIERLKGAFKGDKK